MNGDIDKLIKFIAEHFTFDEAHYPELKGASKEGRLIFALKHSALHFSKTSGKIAAVLENHDHGGELNMDELKENIPKSLITTLRLAELAGMSEQDIISAIEQKYGAKMQT